MNIFRLLALLSCLFGSSSSMGEVATDAIRNSLAASMPGFKVDQISESPVKGLYEVVVGPNLFYISEDGRYLFSGNLFDLQEKSGNRDLTEAKMQAARAKAVLAVGTEVIKFTAGEEKHVVSVFTDIDCGYCRKLHSEIDEYMKRGISIRYLFFPRAGKDTESYRKAVSVWCSEDRQAALTQAKRGNTPDSRECPNPVDQHMELAGSLQIRGTPMIVTAGGVVMPGYVSAEDLVGVLERSEKGSKE